VLGSGGTAAGGGKRKKKTLPRANHPNPNPDLLAALKTWRQQEADRLQKPLYCILTNKTIEELVTHTPNTADDLSKIHGIGPKKMSDYGTHLLSLTTSRRK
jgi:superfamily II DNA helicase RecQ